ncbi:hypothetical protein F4677DRAFT_423270 [Hypoxylon crocopeplum]|nr:hypothetical protein F4677DRAFT_423270 [Hypoxylon crocopeplum]
MFEVPDAKRVRREDLYDSASDEEAMPDDQWESSLRGKLNAQLSGLLDLSFTADADADADIEAQQPSEPQIRDKKEDPGGDDGGAEKPGQEAFTFRLFRNEEPSRKVVLEPQNASAEKDGGCGFIVARRPISYYLAEEPPLRVTKEFKMAAISADYLFQDAKRRRWGLEKPWKVTTISIITKTGKDVSHSSSGHDAATQVGNQKRKRPGKKRRIILRVREKAKKKQEEVAKHGLVEKEEHLKEKKKRLNRQKKLKRRAKEREKKQSMNDDAASEQNTRDSSPTQE